jgi:hypothetical protein
MLQAECPRCPTALVEQEGDRVCPVHGSTAPLLRTSGAGYDALVEHLATAGGMPSWVPWPLPQGWTVTGMGAVRPEGGQTRATFVTCGGTTDSDGVVQLTVVTEEPGVGLGSRVARVVHDDPGTQMLGRPVQTRIEAGGASVPLWLVSTSEDGALTDEDPLDRAVLVGEARGRWLWVVVTPASASLDLTSWGPLEDLGGRGPELMELTFVERPSDW